MSQVLDELVSLLKLETIEQGLYRGQSQDLGFKALFGGQVIGQALSGAKETVDKDRPVHSLHSYFLRPGDAYKPVVYDVECVRDGGSISTRRVKAIQNGKPIFYMTASFQVSEPGFEHQVDMPDVAGPEGLDSLTDIARALQEHIPESSRDFFTTERPIEMRPVESMRSQPGVAQPPIKHIWVKANGMLPDDMRIHKYLLAYASDFMFLPTAAQPHGVSLFTPGLQMATIDHSMWFHHPARVDEWLLYAIDSPVTSGGRGLVRGQYFTTDGKLIASTMQEGVIRHRKP